MSANELEPYRYVGDLPIDTILSLLRKEQTPLEPTEDLFSWAESARLMTESDRSPAQQALVDFINHYQTLPDWVDVDQLRRGQHVYLKFAPTASLSLYYRSLIPGFSIPKIAAVVRSTRYLAPPSRPDQVVQRLMDTGGFLMACMSQGVDAILPGNIGWKMALQVRALHAKVRHALLLEPGRWKISQWGVPINQEDLAATLLAFSVNVLVGIEFVAGVAVSRQDRLDYLALWRYLGWLLGVETVMSPKDFPSPIRMQRQEQQLKLHPLDPCGPGSSGDPIVHSASMLQAIIFHILHPDHTSIEIAHHLLKISSEKKKPPSDRQRKTRHKVDMDDEDDEFKTDWFYFRSLQCRRFIGQPLADALQLPYHPIRWKRWRLWIFSTGYLLVLRCYTLATMYLPTAVGSWAFRRHRQGMQTFFQHWTSTHQSNLAQAIAEQQNHQRHVQGQAPLRQTTNSRNRSGANQDQDPVSETQHESKMQTATSSLGLLNESGVSVCPFSMVNSPQLGD